MTIPASHIDLLERPVIWHVATIGPSGEPQSSPVWAGLDDDGTVVISMLKRRQKVTNLKANAAVALSACEHRGDRYRHVELRGTASIEDDPDHTLIYAMAKKYLGVDDWDYVDPKDARVTIRITVILANTMG